MKLCRNNKFIDLKDGKIVNKLDCCYQDGAWEIKQFKEELTKIDALDENVKNALDNISNMQELQLEQIRLYEQMKHAILKKYDIYMNQFQFRNM